MRRSFVGFAIRPLLATPLIPIPFSPSERRVPLAENTAVFPNLHRRVAVQRGRTLCGGRSSPWKVEDPFERSEKGERSRRCPPLRPGGCAQCPPPPPPSHRSAERRPP